jgi:hypothetical protein
MLVCFALAICHSTEKRRTLILRNALELTAVPVILWIVFQVWAANYQQSDHLRLTYLGDTFGIPRVYRPHQSSERDSYEYIDVVICWKTGDPAYAKACTANSSVMLSTRRMIEEPNVYTVLDWAGATYDSDFVTNRGSGAETLPDGSFYYEKQGSRYRFLLDKSEQIERFSSCFNVTGTCNIATRTPHGTLTFSAKTTDTDAANFWRAKEMDWLANFDGWKCVETTCDGRFD